MPEKPITIGTTGAMSEPRLVLRPPHMDLVAPFPVFNLYNDRWPVYTMTRTLPPAKLVYDGDRGAPEVFDTHRSLCAGAIVSGARVHRAVVSPGVRVERGSFVENSILLDDVIIGEGAIVRNAVIDKNVVAVPRAPRSVSTLSVTTIVSS